MAIARQRRWSPVCASRASSPSWSETHPIDSEGFEAYVRHILRPELRLGDIVVMDNLSSHKPPQVRALIEEAGASLFFLPPCNPDFNPIEMVFAKLKALLRKAQLRAVEVLWDGVGKFIDVFKPHECEAYFTACGYHPE